MALGAALWYLSRDNQSAKFDPKVHTVEELRKIVHEMFVEGATLYCQKINLMRQLKASGDFNQDSIDQMRKKQAGEMEEAEQDIYQDFKITENFFQDWLQRYIDDPVIKKYFDRLNEIEATVFNQTEQSIAYIPCDNLPDGLDEDKYILIYRKQQQCIRHHIFKVLKETGGQT